MHEERFGVRYPQGLPGIYAPGEIAGPFAEREADEAIRRYETHVLARSTHEGTPVPFAVNAPAEKIPWPEDVAADAVPEALPPGAFLFYERSENVYRFDHDGLTNHELMAVIEGLWLLLGEDEQVAIAEQLTDYEPGVPLSPTTQIVSGRQAPGRWLDAEGGQAHVADR